MKEEPFPPGSRLVAYLRDSGGSEQELSVPQQRQAVEEWCRANGCHLTRAFVDAARSGKTTAGRDAFLELVDYFHHGATEQGVILWEYSRFARDYDDTMFYLAELRRSGCAVYALQDQIPAGLDGRLLESLIAWRNAKFLEDLARNVRRGLQYVKEHHHAYQPAIPPVGYRKAAREIGARRDGQPHTVNVLEPDPEKAYRVRLAFEMKAAGHSRQEIHAATRLFEAPSSYARMFRNRVYLGEYGGVAGYCEPLVEQATFDAVQERIAGRTHPRREMSAYLLSGLLHCSACGLMMIGFPITSRGRRFLYYRCVSHWRFGTCAARMLPAGEIERLVLARLKDYLTDPSIRARVAAEVERLSASATNDFGTQVAPLRASLAETRASVARLVSAIKEAGHSPALLAALEKEERKEQEYAQQVETLERAARARLERLPSPEQIAAAYESARQGLESHDRRSVQLLTRSFVAEVHAEKTDTIRGEITFVTPTGQTLWSLEA